jgi:hypothetical protein
LDYDNDGWLDLFIANGHVYPEVEQSTSDESYLQNNQLLRNLGNGTFAETTKEAGDAFQIRHAGRGAAFGDLDNDGKLDIVVSNNDGSPVILRNSNGSGNGFVSFQLTATKGARNAIGSRVFVKTAETRQMREVKSGGSYLSSNDSRLHFGTGKARTLLSVEVVWASGAKQTFQNVPANAFYALREGDRTLSPQKSLSK